MVCSNCIESKPIPVCSGELIIGTVTTDAEVYVFIQNLATGYIAKQSAVPDQYNSTVSIDMTLPYPDFYSPNFYFKLWISETEDGNDPIEFTIDAVAYECLTVIFQKQYIEDEIDKLDSITIKV